jgi:hypothetical protein
MVHMKSPRSGGETREADCKYLRVLYILLHEGCHLCSPKSLLLSMDQFRNADYVPSYLRVLQIVPANPER